MRLRVSHQQSQFGPILARFMDYYSLIRGPKAISMVVEPQVVLTCWPSTLAVWLVLARFLDYYSLFWGPGVIFMVDEPRGAFTCPSSTLAISADFGKFHALLLTVWGSERYFHDC